MINRTGEAWPSLNTIADRCEITERMVQKHLAVAEKLGLITIKRTVGKKSVYSLPTPEQYDTPSNSSPLNNSSPPPRTIRQGSTLLNRNGTVINKKTREAKEKKEWVEVVKQAAIFCGGQPLTTQHIQIIEEKYPKLDLLDQALAFEAHHIEKHNKANYRTFATYARFSTNWLSRAEQEPQHGKNGFTQERVRTNSRGKVVTRLVKPGEPSPLL